MERKGNGEDRNKRRERGERVMGRRGEGNEGGSVRERRE